MAEKAQTSGSKRKIRQWSHEVLNNVAEKPDDERLEVAEEALDKAPDDDARQTLIELSIASPDDITAAFVRAAVRKGSMQLARAAADLLMDVTEADSAQSIIQECLVADDRSVRRRAVEAIETLEGPAALELLTEAFNADDNGVRRAAVNTFGLIVGSKYHALKSNLMELLRDRESELYKSIVESEDMNLRREIAQVLGYADRPDVVTILEDLSKDPDTQTRRETVLALAALRNERAVEILRDKLDDPDEVLVSSVLDCLAAQQGRESAEMLDALRKGLKHPDPDVRRHAVLMLNQFELSEVEELLKETTGDSDYEVERSAKELLRMLESEAGAPTLEESEKDQSAEEQTLSIWEAGNIGMESESAAESSAIKSRSSADAGDVLPILERTAIEGSSSQRVHAITELLELEDIAESYALQRALYDSEDVVRSRASAALDNTRDAGLLVDVLQRHPDALTRRRAVEALRDNPGGRQETWGRLSVSFTSERSEGMEVFSYLLEALQDHDEGVRQIVLRAIEEFVEFNCPFPVPQTIEALQRLTEDESLSALFRENVGQLIEDIEEANF
ncbi:MAG: HEAT repeat domain-containing protein, partial [Planctomycetes bacterium]|nr:HEAT repeat domain-containing protein [Planctomycetota bacterium]